MKKWSQSLLVCLIIAGSVSAIFVPSSNAQGQPAYQFQVAIDPTAHQRFGLYYPVTYTFLISGGLSNLTAQYRYLQTDIWNNLPVRTSADFFNGINAARFDYGARRAYLSVAFAQNSDTLFLRVVDSQSNQVPMVFQNIPLYYDNRTAAVSVSLDDWDSQSVSWDTASRILTNAHVHFTGAIVSQFDAGREPDWSLIQYWYNQGYLEPGAHSRSHPCSDSDYQVHGYAWEIAGIRDDILANLTLQYPYVPAFMLPCGFESAAVRQAIVNANYLADRGAAPYLIGFAPWGQDGAYQQALYTYATFDWAWPGSTTRRDEANAAFDTAYAAGGIYHLVDHPVAGLWADGPYLSEHITYVSNRPDVWYAAFGELYLYHYVQERGQVTVSPLEPTAVTLSSFDAQAQRETNLIRWKTASELDNFGFNLYRAEGLNEVRTRLNETLIPAQSAGGLVGADYEFEDLAKGKTYYYWLETVGADDTELYGPATVTSGAPCAPYLPLLCK